MQRNPITIAASLAESRSKEKDPRQSSQYQWEDGDLYSIGLTWSLTKAFSSNITLLTRTRVWIRITKLSVLTDGEFLIETKLFGTRQTGLGGVLGSIEGYNSVIWETHAFANYAFGDMIRSRRIKISWFGLVLGKSRDWRQYYWQDMSAVTEVLSCLKQGSVWFHMDERGTVRKFVYRTKIVARKARVEVHDLSSIVCWCEAQQRVLR